MTPRVSYVDKKSDLLLNAGFLAFLGLIGFHYGFFESAVAAISFALVLFVLLLVAFVVFSALEKITA